MGKNETHGSFNDVLSSAPAALRPVCNSLREQITSLHKDFVEIVWPRQKIASYGVGPKKMSEHYAYIAVQSSHINLGFYHGASLADPAGLLEGTGKGLRHIKIRDVAAASQPAVVALLRVAIADRKANATKP